MIAISILIIYVCLFYRQLIKVLDYAQGNSLKYIEEHFNALIRERYDENKITKFLEAIDSSDLEKNEITKINEIIARLIKYYWNKQQKELSQKLIDFFIANTESNKSKAKLYLDFPIDNLFIFFTIICSETESIDNRLSKGRLYRLLRIVIEKIIDHDHQSMSGVMFGFMMKLNQAFNDLNKDDKIHSDSKKLFDSIFDTFGGFLFSHDANLKHVHSIIDCFWMEDKNSQNTITKKLTPYKIKYILESIKIPINLDLTAEKLAVHQPKMSESFFYFLALHISFTKPCIDSIKNSILYYEKHLFYIHQSYAKMNQTQLLSDSDNTLMIINDYMKYLDYYSNIHNLLAQLKSQEITEFCNNNSQKEAIHQKFIQLITLLIDSYDGSKQK